MPEAYDPQGPEDGPQSSSSHYLSKKDLKWISIILVVLAIVLTPVYRLFRENANDHVCKQNLSQIYKALSVYEASNDGRYPPLFASDSAGAPVLDDHGRAFSWISLLQSGMNDRSSFVCPSTVEVERTHSQHPSESNKTIEGTYGFYTTYGLPAPNGDMEVSEVPNPETVVLIAETSNGNASRVYDPMPYKDAAGKVVPEGGLTIGYDDSNLGITRESKYVTRLAFPDTADGKFEGKAIGRHAKGIHMISASGMLLNGIPPESKMDLTSPGKPTGRWMIPTGVGSFNR